MSPIAVVGFILAIVGGLLMIVGAVRRVKRTSVNFAVLVCVATLLMGVGFLVRAVELPVGSGWFIATITAGMFWISAAAFYGFTFRRTLSRSR